MKTTIKIPYGLREGSITHISEVESGLSCGCFCIACETPLVARKGTKRAHYFAHTNDSGCTETVLHKLGKTFLKQRIDQCIQSQQPLPFSWDCAFCNQRHEANLVKKVTRCAEETTLANTRADLALFDAEERLFAAVEIVVTHKPEDSARETYVANDVICIECDLKTAADLEALKSSPALTPQRVGFCLMPRCPECRTFLLQRKVHVVDASCWSCSAPMKMAFGFDGNSMMGPEEFATVEIETAKAAGAFLERRFSKTVEKSYLANVCKSCNKISGSFFLHDYWFLSDEVPPLLVAMGCPRCETTVSNSVSENGTRMIERRPSTNEDSTPQIMPVAPRYPKLAIKQRRTTRVVDSIAKPQSPVVSKTPTVRKPPRWGRCEACGKESCPTVLKDGEWFFCSFCKSSVRFIPDVM